MPILLTGFTPFAAAPTNPSQRVAEAIARRAHLPDVVTAILPTEFAAAEECLLTLLHTVQPHAVLMLGVATKRTEINLERVALNLNDAPLPDNTGIVRTGHEIVPNGPVGYWSTLPLAAMEAALRAHHIPVAYSNHAGTYVCNHVFYLARHTLPHLPCGFIHLPPLDVLPLDTQVEAIEHCLSILRSSPHV